jgi:uncharacterized damage-inducible protein DinB
MYGVVASCSRHQPERAMARIDALLAEFVHETNVARRHLERLPDDRFDWRPHVRSWTTGELGAHMVDCVRWTEPVFGADELDMDPHDYAACRATSVASILEAFDAAVARGTRVMTASSDPSASMPWRFRVRGTLRWEKPREAVFRDMTLNHLVHHRGQFTVYLRLLDVPVPGSYGPTADEGS